MTANNKPYTIDGEKPEFPLVIKQGRTVYTLDNLAEVEVECGLCITSWDLKVTVDGFYFSADDLADLHVLLRDIRLSWQLQGEKPYEPHEQQVGNYTFYTKLEVAITIPATSKEAAQERLRKLENVSVGSPSNSEYIVGHPAYKIALMCIENADFCTNFHKPEFNKTG